MFSNFYEDYGVDNDQFEYMVNVYNALGSTINGYIEQVKSNIIIPQIETYRFIPIQRVDTSDAFYSLQSVLQKPEVIERLNLQGMNTGQKLDVWNNLSIEEKIEVLYMLSLYLQLEAKRGLPVEPLAKVMDFDMINMSGQQLIRNTNYSLANNRVYLTGDTSALTVSKEVNFNNIAIDFNTPYNLMGNKIIPFMAKGSQSLFNDKLTKNEYTDIMKMILMASLGGPTIINLKNAIRSLSGLESADIYDKYTKDMRKKERWNRWDLFNFNFLVTLPEDYISDLDKLEILSGFLNLIKPAYTQFFIILIAEYSEIFNKHLINDYYYADNITDLYAENAHSNILYDELISVFGLDSERYILPSKYFEQLSRLNFRGRLNVDFRTYFASKIDGGLSGSLFDALIDGGYAGSEFEYIIDGGYADNNVFYFHFDKINELQQENANLSIDDSYHEDSFSDLLLTEEYDNIIEEDIETTFEYAKIRFNGDRRLNISFRTCNFPDTKVVNY